MLQTFFGIATSGGAETATVVASGISEALVTTETGLTIALPGLFLVMFIQRQAHQIEAKLSRLESLTITCLNLKAKKSLTT
jgi:biopolymer transport protein ExbB